MGTKESVLDMQIDMSKIVNNKFVQLIFNLLFGISVAGLNMILIEQRYADNYVYIILPILSFVIAEIMAIRFKFLEKTFKDVKKITLIISILFGIFEIINLTQSASYNTYLEVVRICSIIAIPAVIIFLYWFYTKLVYYFKRYIKSLDKIEKNFLIIAGTILIISIIVIYNFTTVFYSIKTEEKDYNYQVTYEQKNEVSENEVYEYIKYLYETNQYDTIYTSDTAPLLYEDVYGNITTNENDIRQPLFGVFAIPFHILPNLIANIFRNIPNLYAILIAIIQGMLTLIAFTLLARLMKVNKLTKILFLSTLFFAYPTLLFLLNLEQYTMAVFYLVVFIYLAVNNINDDKDITYIAATGSMLTTGILFPLLGEKKNIKQSIKNILITFIKCIAILIISARIILVFPKATGEYAGRIFHYSNSSESTINTKFNMYTNFVKNIVLASEFNIEEERVAASKSFDTENTKAIILIALPGIRQTDTSQFNILGVSILLLAILGFIANRKDKFSQISFVWIAFSFVLLFLVGWGIRENGLILYIYYFSWAFICLIYKLFDKILAKHEKIKNTVYIGMLLSMLLINLPIIYKTIQFGIQYFKC